LRTVPGGEEGCSVVKALSQVRTAGTAHQSCSPAMVWLRRENSSQAHCELCGIGYLGSLRQQRVYVRSTQITIIRTLTSFTFRDGKIALKNSYRKNRPPLASSQS
jgi:hypothetical protein